MPPRKRPATKAVKNPKLRRVNLLSSAINQKNLSQTSWPGFSPTISLVLVVVVALIVGGGLYYLSTKTKLGTTNNAVSVQTNKNTNHAPELDVSTAWTIPASAKDAASTTVLAQPENIYATKAGKIVTVWKRNAVTGAEAEIIHYTENSDASESADSGNTWDGLPPSVALSHDGTRLAYAAADGLYVYDLSTGLTNALITQTSPAIPNNTDLIAPPTWSIPEMTDAYSMVQPSWSYDDSYISFVEPLSEGSWSSAIEVATKKYLMFTNEQSENPQKRLMVSIQPINWSTAALAGVIPGNSFGYSTPGLFITGPDNFGVFTKIPIAGVQNNQTSIVRAALAPTGDTVAYTTKLEWEGLSNLFVVGLDGTNNILISENADISCLFFSKNGETLYYVQRYDEADQLVAYDLASRKTAVAAILPSSLTAWTAPFWTTEGYLSIAGYVPEGHAQAGTQNQLFLLDLASKSVVYASPVSGKFTNYLGFIK